MSLRWIEDCENTSNGRSPLPEAIERTSYGQSLPLGRVPPLFALLGLLHIFRLFREHRLLREGRLFREGRLIRENRLVCEDRFLRNGRHRGRLALGAHASRSARPASFAVGAPDSWRLHWTVRHL